MLFSSPFFRCLQTAEPVADVLELPVYVEPGIGEWYSPGRDVIPEPASLDLLNNFFPEKLKEPLVISVVPSTNGESEQDMFNRCRHFWCDFTEILEKQFPNVECIMLFTHAATKIALGMNLLGLDNCRDPIDDEGTIIRSGACSLDRYELLEEQDDMPFINRHWKMTMNGNTEFLKKGEEMCWDFSNCFEAGSDNDIKTRELKSSSNSDKNSEDTEEHVYVSIDLPNNNYRDRNELDYTATLQYSGLDQEKPLFKIGEHIYEGTWKKLVGTELAFPGFATTKKKVNDSADERKDEDNYKASLNSSTDHEKVKAEKIYRIVNRLTLSELDRV